MRSCTVWNNSGMSLRRSSLAWGALAVGAALAGFLLARHLHDANPQLTSGTWFPQPRPVGPLELTGDDGKPFGHEKLEGAPTLVFFGFTHCPDVCPTTLAQLAQITKASGVPGLRVLLVSVDPERDTPETLHQYVRAFDPSFIGATGTKQGITRIAKEFGVAVERVALPGDTYTMDHSAAVFLLNDRAQIVAVFTPPFDPDAFAADLRTAAPWLAG
jgi:protein SCO1